MALAKEGVDITLVARGVEALGQAGEGIRNATGAKVKTVVANINTDAGRAAAIATCPKPDILLNNAGGKKPGDFRDWRRDDWISLLYLMMLAPIEMMRLTFDGMVNRGFGRIVNIAARGVKIPQVELGLSNGARTGLVGFSAGLAREGIARNVTINTILPGIIINGDAQRLRVASLVKEVGLTFDEIWEKRAAQSPRYGRPEEVGALFAFLASDHSDPMTGQSILMDGGDYPGTL